MEQSGTRDILLDQSGLEKLASDYARTVRSGDIFLLYGSLGSGKSVFIRAFLRELGVEGNIPSPTFIVNAAYSIGTLEIQHIDLYRLSGSHEELEAYGIEEALEGEIVVLIEWADRLSDQCIDDSILIRLEFTEDPMERRVMVDDRRMAGN